MIGELEKADPTKAKILEAAGIEFAAHGFEKATVRAICRRAGVNLAAVNYHFDDKLSLYLTAVNEAHQCGVEELPEEEWRRGTPSEQLRRFIGHFLRRVLDIEQGESWHHELMVREMIRPTKVAAVFVDQNIRPRYERLKSILKALGPKLDDKRLMALCFSVIGQCLFYKTTRAFTSRLIGKSSFDAMTHDFLTDHITRVTLAAVNLHWPAQPRDNGAR
jgi:AcrR family transcriptional regulator